MANTIKIRRSAVPGKVPLVGDLQLGELALNTYDGKLYAKRDQGGVESVVELSGGGGGGGSNYSFGPTPPASPNAGDAWTDSDDGITYIYVNDGDSSQWVELGPPPLRGPTGPKSITLNNPTNSENILLLYTDIDLDINEIRSVISGASSPSITFYLKYSTDISSAGTDIVTGGIICSNTTTGVSTTSFTNATIPAGNFLWLTTGAISGTLTMFHATTIFA